MRTLVFVVVSATIHLLFARWVISAWPAARRRARLVFGVASALAAAMGALRLFAAAHDGAIVRGLLAGALVELAVVGLSLVPLGVVVLVARVGEAAARRLSAAAPADLVSRREALERIAGTTAVASASIAVGWGAARGRHAFALEEVVVRVAGWPRALEGYTIAQVSDVHCGLFVGDRELDEGFELVKRARPDLVVATGDLVDFDAAAIGPLARRLAAVTARDGAYAIVGNHDHYAGPAEVVARLRAAGVRVLCNEGVRVRARDGGGFALVGLDDLQGRRRPVPGFSGPDLGRALAPLPPDVPRVLLAHQPRFFRESAGRVALQLSGHTHGGQINPGFTPARALLEFVRGRYERAGSTLWVNRGFGVAGPPVRLGAPPEITRVVIVAA